jgi:hypothetical protein
MGHPARVLDNKGEVLLGGWSRSFQNSNFTAGSYSGTRVAVPADNSAKWLFPQEKATSNTLGEGMFTLVSL